eukprot:tig00020693_g13043.t1
MRTQDSSQPQPAPASQRAGLLVALAVVIALTLIGCLTTRLPLPFSLSDKQAHFIAFAGLCALGTACFKDVMRMPIRQAALASLAVCIAFGACTEVLQDFVPGRAADVLDFQADVFGSCAGAAVGVALASAHERARLHRREDEPDGDAAP